MNRILFSVILAVSPAAFADAPSSTAIDAMETYFDFAEFNAGIVSPKQITSEEQLSAYYIIDTRLPEDYAASHLFGARQIEWRNLLARRNELPKDRPVLLYCNTGAQSAQSFFALRVAGWDNVRLLLGGLQGWTRENGNLAIVK